ncbi:hypothetical protein ACQUY5_23680 [Bacillus cereus]|uniref:hypothetical protein n=1 Tax=Bacillus cereus TaxID=1396 RepID=UPI003D1733A4
MKTVEECKRDLQEDDRFDEVNGCFLQKSKCCVNCTSKQGLNSNSVEVIDENGRPQFEISFWKCQTCIEIESNEEV